MLVSFARELGDRAAQTVWCLKTPGLLAKSLEQANILVVRSPVRADVIHAWLHIGCAASVPLRALWPGVPIVWHYHTQGVPPGAGTSTRWAYPACRQLSGLVPKQQLACSASAQQAHREDGFVGDIAVVPNAVDASFFSPAPDRKLAARDGLGLPRDTTLVGWIARWDEAKDPRALATAMALASQDLHFVLCGRDLDSSNPALGALLSDHGVLDRCTLLGVQSDMREVYHALDAITLSSKSEALPMVALEAMACGVPVVARPVGDLKDLVENHGVSVAAEDPRALAQGWNRVRDVDVAAARIYVRDNHGLADYANRMMTLYQLLAA